MGLPITGFSLVAARAGSSMDVATLIILSQPSITGPENHVIGGAAFIFTVAEVKLKRVTPSGMGGTLSFSHLLLLP